VSRATERVQAALAEQGMAVEIRTFPDGTRTAEQAAAAVGVEVGQIVKSLVFVRPGSGRHPLLVLTSGANRVDEGRVGQLVGEPIARAGADEVRTATGFSIGGVPPVGHGLPLDVFVDEDLLRYGVVWAAAGTPHDVFSITPDDLVRVTDGRVARVAT
jgi:prolyl-tRNA editing enzyme YbaK/EbsC (Cys-tRNA(Pro) deacylase)